MQEKINKNYEVIFPQEGDEHLFLLAATLINAYAEQGIMLEVTAEQLQLIAAQGLLALAIDEQQQVVGTAGITLVYPDGKMEFGGWSVQEDWKASGVGKQLLATLLGHSQLSDKNIIAFGNQNSGPIFQKLGAVVMDQSQVHQNAFVPCQACGCKDKDKLLPGQQCVDVIFDLNPLKKLANH